jgi:tetratricopeptide (TPR) repeat protein
MFNRGLAYADLKQFKKAIQDYNQAIELNPKDARVFNNRGTAYAKLNWL